MEFVLKDVFYIATQLVIVTSVVVTNKQNIAYLKKENAEHKSLLKELQDKLNDIRVKVGI